MLSLVFAPNIHKEKTDYFLILTFFTLDTPLSDPIIIRKALYSSIITRAWVRSCIRRYNLSRGPLKVRREREGRAAPALMQSLLLSANGENVVEEGGMRRRKMRRKGRMDPRSRKPQGKKKERAGRAFKEWKNYRTFCGIVARLLLPPLRRRNVFKPRCKN